jgi:uncharacterized phiE125 gp8 family phage protein
MALTRISGPAFDAVDLATLKSHARVLHSDDDALLGQLGRAAVQHLDGYTGILGLCLASQQWELSFDAFPCGAIKLPLGPVLAVDEITFTDAAGDAQTVAVLDYEVDLTNGDGWVVPRESWPVTGSFLNAARIRFTAGHALLADVPEALRVAAMMLAAHWYNNREGQGEVPASVAALVMPFKRVWLA